MFTKLLIIQKIDENGDVNVFQTGSDYLRWTFESKVAKSEASPEYFPFQILGESKVIKRKPGLETEASTSNNQILFSDDYDLPEGSVIGILFPKNYIPDVLKFKDKPNIPVNLNGQVITRSPGQMQILYNKIEKYSAITLHIHERVFFGIKCLIKKVSDENFPENNELPFDDLDITISREFLGVEAIQ